MIDNKTILQTLVSENPFKYGAILKTEKYKSLYDWILENTKTISSSGYSLKTKIYWILNGIETFDNPKAQCPVCHKPLIGKNVVSINEGYRACSVKCSNNSKNKIKKIIESNKKREKPKKIINVSPIIPNSNIELTKFKEFLNTLTDSPIIENHPVVSVFSASDKKLAIHFVLFSDGKMNDKNDLISLIHGCSKNGYRLIVVFEDDWILRQNIVKSRLRNIFGKTSNKISARKCTIREISFKESSSFLKENHIQGPTASSKLNLGLFFNDELVSVMTFSKPRYSDHDWELLRYCNKLDTIVVGGASKLFHRFLCLQSPKSVISYADRCWSSGNLYVKLKFKLSHISKPNYFYVSKNNLLFRESRVKYQKHKLKEKLKIYDDSLTEKENMKNNGYFRLYDCGSMAYVYEY